MGVDVEKVDERPPSLPRPSQSYQEARESGVNRLSELMFGSLLASYVLGFIAFLALLPPPPNGGWIPVPSRVDYNGPWRSTTISAESKPPAREGTASPADDHRPSAAYRQLYYFAPFAFYLLISLSFTYLTVGMYVSYHIGILTMPHPPLGRLSWDFIVSLLPAFGFGLAMLVPRAYLSIIAVVWTFVIWRQLFEARQLESFLENTFLPKSRPIPHGNRRGRERDILTKQQEKRAENKQKKARIRHVRQLLAQFPALARWGRPDRRTLLYLIVLYIAAAASDTGLVYFIPGHLFDTPSGAIVHNGLLFLCAIMNVVIGHLALSRRSDLLGDLTPQPWAAPATAAGDSDARLNSMDDAAMRLERLLRESPIEA